MWDMDDDGQVTQTVFYKTPSFWFSLFAAVISAIGFYQGNLRAGTLKVQLPEEVGVMLNYDTSVDFLVPTVVYNTGNPGDQRIVTTITADIIADNNQIFKYRWRDTWDFIGKIEFESRFPNNIARLPAEDYIIYNSRSAPYVVSGGDSDYRVVRLRPLDSDGVIPDLSRFTLVYTIITSNGKFQHQGVYAYQSGLRPGQYVWFQKSD